MLNTTRLKYVPRCFKAFKDFVDVAVKGEMALVKMELYGGEDFKQQKRSRRKV
jgi:hypothetical protein